MRQGHHSVSRDRIAERKQHESSINCRVPRLSPLLRAIRDPLVGAAFALTLVPVVQPALAQPAQQSEAGQLYNIPPGPLGAVLSRFAGISGVVLSFDPVLLAGKNSPGLQGRYGVEEGFAILLKDSGYAASRNDAGYMLVPRPQVAQASTSAGGQRMTDASGAAETTVLPTLTVTDEDDGFKAKSQTTATKSSLSIRETPQAISVVTQNELRARQVFDVGTALQTSAGVSQVSGNGPFAGRNHFGHGVTQIRGINLTPSTAFISSDREDGMRSAAFATQQDLSLYERIEVVKGPSSALYGRSSAGGFVNRVRKQPLQEFHAEVAPTVGSFDFYRLDGDITGPLTDAGKMRGRLVMAYEDSGSFVDHVEGNRVVVAPGLDINLSPATRLLLLGSYQRDEFIPNPGFPLMLGENGKYRAPKIPRSRFVGLPNEEENHTEIQAATAMLEQKLGDHWLVTLTLSGGVSDEVEGSLLYAYGLAANGDISYLFSTRVLADREAFTGDLRLNGNIDLLDRPATVTLGIDQGHVALKRKSVGEYGYNFSVTPNIYLNNFADIPGIPNAVPGDFDFIAEDREKGVGVYAQIQFRPSDRLSVLLGGRYDRVNTSRDTDLANFFYPSQDIRSSEFTSRAALTFELQRNITTYGLFSQAFDPVVNSDVNGEFLEPRTGEIFEAGVKTDWLNGRLGINAAAFRLERDKIPLRVGINPGGQPVFRSSGLQRSDGIELEINGILQPGWNLSFGGVLLDAKFLGNKDEDPNAGRAPEGAADWQLGLFTSYEFQTGSLRGLGAGLGFYAIDDRGIRNQDNLLEGYERVDVSLFYNRFENTQIALQVRNVFDKTYVETAYDAAGPASFGSPLAALLTVRYKFER